MTELLKVEIGGGAHFARGSQWVNIDWCDEADIKHNLNGSPWPIADDSASEIYSSHCIEHVHNPHMFLDECARIGIVGCTVEIRCPAPHSDLAMVADHKHVFAPQGARNAEYHFPELHWKHRKRLKLLSHVFQPSEMLEWAKAELPFLKGLSDDVIMRWIPRTTHDTVFMYQVVENEYFRGANQ